MLASLLLLASSAHAFLVPPTAPRTVVRRSGSPTMADGRPQHQDSSDFLLDPITYIKEHPELFTEDLQEMAAYQIKANTEQMFLWGDLPESLDTCAKGAAYLRQKSAAADELARIILRADQNTMSAFVKDSTFEEKKKFFENLAALPDDDNGMLAVDRVATQMLDAGELPLIKQFDEDIKRVTEKIAEVNDELMKLDDVYTTLFLAVRKVSKLARTAADVSKSK